jgi:hypothetical protein
MIQGHFQAKIGNSAHKHFLNPVGTANCHSLGQRTSRRAPSNSVWGRRYDPWHPTGLPIFGVEDIVRDGAGGRQVN